MKLFIIQKGLDEIVVLLDDNMRIVKPVYDYFKFLKLKNRSVNTVRAAGRDLTLYWNFLSEKTYDYKEVTPPIIGEFIEFLREPKDHEGLSYLNAVSFRTGKTINRILSTVNNFYIYCNSMISMQNPIIMHEVAGQINLYKGMLYHTKDNHNVTTSIFKVKDIERRIHIVSDIQAKIFLDSLPTWRDKLIFKIMYFTGIRIGELLSLCIEDITFSNDKYGVCTINVTPRTTNRYDQKDKSGARPIFMPKSLLIELDNFIMEERCRIDTTHSYLFVSAQKQHLGKPLTYRGLYEVFKNVSKKTGIELNFHDLRHTCITRLIESGIDLSVAKIIAGHKNIATTQHYTHLTNKFIEKSLSTYWDKSILIDGGLR